MLSVVYFRFREDINIIMELTALLGSFTAILKVAVKCWKQENPTRKQFVEISLENPIMSLLSHRNGKSVTYKRFKNHQSIYQGLL